MRNRKWSVYSHFLLLLLPLIGMLVSDEINWSLFDFILMGGLLLSLSFGLKFILHKTTNIRYRILLIGILLLLFLLIWAELAVGIFGTPFAGN